MDENLDLCLALWNRLSPYIGKKDKVHAADSLIECFDEHGLADNFENSIDEVDRELRAAIASRFGLSDEDGDY